MSELKKCPFCKGEAEFIRKGDNRQSNEVSCTDCGAYLEDGATFNHEEAWNTRPREEELEKENKKLTGSKNEPYVHIRRTIHFGNVEKMSISDGD